MSQRFENTCNEELLHFDECEPTPNIILDYGPAGSFKTSGMVQMLRRNMQKQEIYRVIFSQPTLALLKQTEKDLKEAIPDVPVIRIDSETLENYPGLPAVSALLQIELGKAFDLVKVILLISHDSLKHLTSKNVTSFHIVIDEIPSFFKFHKTDSDELKYLTDQSLVQATSLISASNVLSLQLSSDGKAKLKSFNPKKNSQFTQNVVKTLSFFEQARQADAKVFHSQNFFVYQALNAEIFKSVMSCWILGADPKSNYFQEYVQYNGLSIEFDSVSPDYTYMNDPSYKLNFGPFVNLPTLDLQQLKIRIYYLYNDNRLLSLSSLEKNNGDLAQQIGRKIKRLFDAGNCLHSRRDRCYWICNIDSPSKSLKVRSKIANAANLALVDVLSPGASGLNHLQDRDTVICIAATWGDKGQFNAIKSIFGSRRSFSEYQCDLIGANMYQAVMRSKLRNITRYEDVDIRIVVYGKAEAEILRSWLLSPLDIERKPTFLTIAPASASTSLPTTRPKRLRKRAS